MLLESELKRKAIHLASLSIPIAYYLSPDPWTRTWERALLASVIVALAIELFRLHNPQIRGIFRHFFGEIVRNHEDASLLGSTYLLIAMLLTIHLFEKPVAVLALAFLVLGDTVAAIVGKSIGTHRLLGGKTIEGSLACFATCFGLTLLMPGIPFWVTQV